MSQSSVADLVSTIVEAALSPTPYWDGWETSVGRLRVAPDTQVAFYDTPGQAPEVKYRVDYPTIQIMVRGAKDDYSNAMQMANFCKDILLGTDPIDINSGEDRIDGITMLGDVNFLQYDELSRPLVVANYRLIMERVPTDFSHRISL